MLLAADSGCLAGAAAMTRPGAAWGTVLAVLVLASRATARVYRQRLRLSVLDEAPRLVSTVLGPAGLLLLVAVAQDRPHSATQTLLDYAAVFLAASAVAQAVLLTAARVARNRSGSGRRTLVLGAGQVGVGLVSTLLAHPELGLLPIGFADPDALTVDGELPLPVVLHDLADLQETLVAYDVDTIIIAFSTVREAQVLDTMIAAHQMGCEILVVPRMFELHHDGPDVERVRGVPLIRLRPDPTLRPTWWVKRAADVVLAAVGLAVLSPLLAVLALAVILDSGRPVLFHQERVGLDGRSFRLAKFRTMVPDSEAESASRWSIARDPRVSRIGRLLRRTSLDEVPQLVNVLRGEMSLVGPRPERPRFVQQFSVEHERYWARHRVPVGLTGLAQVSGLRGDTSIRERARYDNYYIANWSLWLDVKIVMLTLREVVSGGGR